MKFQISDSWVLQSIVNTSVENIGSNLIDIIAYADYSQHAIITFNEFSSALNKLILIGIIKLQGKQIFIADDFNKWRERKYANKHRIYVQKEIEVYEKYLNENFSDFEIEASSTTFNFSEIEFSNAVNQYLDKMNKKNKLRRPTDWQQQ